ncbi:tetratricopeptide repeat protein [Mongoliibacter ruber]|uniref:Tetratricopeptide repeat protein n=1 Tax=Mongoliibacter ruber TaxID=1750599 RepID=A0A2T0WDG7_9BACT|nr:tetratricopeptide repeat protein [Mongoliibacter ruber]PRY84742.1 tetratricopeptide repeat protein [Mongoliibacter ruber]
MKNALILIFFLFGSQSMYAQEYFLPISTDSETAKQHYKEALHAAQHADIAGYNESIKKAVADDPEFFMAYAHLALGMASMNQEEAFKEAASKALAISENKLNPAEKSIRKGVKRLVDNPKADLTPVLDELKQNYQEVPQVYELGLFINYWINQDYQAAAENGNMLVKLSPKNAGGYNMLGYALMESGDMKSAKSAFENYIKLAPDEANAYDSMGEYYMNVKDYKKSAKHYEKATQLGMEASRERAEEAKRLMAVKK